MRIANVLEDYIGYVELLESMGNDASIVRRARVCYQSGERSTPESDRALLAKLIDSKPLHGTTLRGVVFTFDVVCPLFVMRQWTRHVVGSDYHVSEYVGADTFDIGSGYDEQSFRYTEPNQFYIPPRLPQEVKAQWKLAQESSMLWYRHMRDLGVTKQLARCFVPQSVYTQMTWTVNAQAVFDWLDKRLPGGGAQTETAAYALAVLESISYIIPATVDIWEKNR